MLLNLLRVEGANPEQMMALSFHQFQNEQAAPALEALMGDKERERDALEVAGEADVELYHALNVQLDRVRQEMREAVNHPKYAVQFLQPGRLVRVKV
jgi:ATP-dependent RNA helicase DOB1